MRVLQKPPPISKKVTYSDTETFLRRLQIPHHALDQLFGTVTHSAVNVFFVAVGFFYCISSEVMSPVKKEREREVLLQSRGNILQV